MIELLSIVVLTFSLALILLGLVTLWLERRAGRWQGVALSLLGLLLGMGYVFLGSRYSLALFGRLIVRVNLPALMVTALVYTGGVLGGVALALGLFLWVTGRAPAWPVRRRTAVLIAAVAFLALVLIFLAVWFSRLPG